MYSLHMCLLLSFLWTILSSIVKSKLKIMQLLFSSLLIFSLAIVPACFHEFDDGFLTQERLRKKENLKRAEAKRNLEKSLRDFGNMDFTSVRVQLLYKRAQKQFGGNQAKLAAIKEELKELDNFYVKVEEMKINNMDPDGSWDDKLNKKFNKIIVKHGLEGPPLKVAPGEFVPRNKRMQELWNKISKMNLTKDELAIFKEELAHFQDRMSEYKFVVESDPVLKMLDSLGEADKERLITSSEVLLEIDTVIAFMAAHPAVTPKVLEEKRLQFLKMRNEIGYGITKWSHITNDTHLLKDNRPPEFHEPIVRRIYEMAQDTNMTVEELDLLKEDLRHVQTKIKKQNFYDQKLTQIQKQKSPQPEVLEKVGWLQKKSNDLGEKIQHRLGRWRHFFASRMDKSEL